MANPQFRCPHCNALLTKSTADQIYGEAAGAFVFGPSTVTCPACGGAIDRASIVSGKYDEKPSLIAGVLGLLVLVLLGGLFIWWMNG